VGALLGIAAVTATLSSPQITGVPLPREEISRAAPTAGGTGSPEPALSPPAPRADPSTLPAWLTSLALGLCLLAVVAVVLALVWVMLRDTMSVRRGALAVEEGEASSLRPRTEDVVAALDAGLSDLSDTDRDPRRAVIACWVRLEQAAAAAGTPRHVGDTPTDLVLRLLGAHRVDRGVLDRFAGIYREARYATHVIDDDMRDQARSALRQLRAELTATAVAP
jgi:hypothetical protein